MAMAETRPQGHPFTIVWIADTHLGFKKSNEAFQKFLADVGTLPVKPDLLINSGDVAEIGDVKSLDAYLSGIKSLGIPAYTVIGNHDTRWSETGKKRFAALVGPRYFSKNFQGIHWIFLDSTIERQPYGHVDFKEMAWIKRDLKKVPPSIPVLTFSHHPFRWRGVSVDDGLDLLNLYRGYNVPAFFNGHGHKLEYVQFRNTPFIENDALFHGDYVVMEKDGDALKLFVKTIGQSGLKPWLEVNLRASPFRGEILSPRLNARVGSSFRARVDSGAPDEARLTLDHRQEISLSPDGSRLNGNVTLDAPGWHVLDLYRSGDALPEDEIRVFYPGPLVSIPVGEIYAGLVSDGRFVFGGTLGGDLFAANVKGRVVWRRRLDGDVVAAPALADGVIYVGTDGGTLYAFRATNGRELWKAHEEAPFTSPPSVSGGDVFVGSGDKCIYAFNAGTGREIWRAQLGGFTEGKAAISHDRIFVGAWDHTFYALNARTGEIVWKKKIGKAIYYSPAVAPPFLLNGRVYVASKDYKLHVLDEKTGEEKWSAGVRGGMGAPILYNGLILVPGVDGLLAAFDVETGKEAWGQKFPDAFFNASPVLRGDDLFLVGVNGKFFEFDLKSRTVLRRYRISYGFDFSTPVVCGGKIWIGSLDGRLYAVPLQLSRSAGLRCAPANGARLTASWGLGTSVPAVPRFGAGLRPTTTRACITVL